MIANPKLLIVNENPATMEIEAQHLSMTGYDVDSLTDINTVMEQLEARRPNLVIIKLECAAMKGLDLLRDGKLPETLPVIVIADVDSTHDLGSHVLRSGVLCYLAHTPTPEYLWAQVHAILRFQAHIEDSITSLETSILTCGPLRLDQRAYRVFIGEKLIVLQPLQFELLAFLMQNARQRFTRSHLLEVVWGHRGFEEQTVTRCVSGIRAKLPEIRDLIRCKAGGYIFEEQVQFA